MPIKIDNQFIQIAKAHKYDYLINKYDFSTFNEFKKSLFTSIQLFGSATQEIDPMIAFIKYYISIEAATKRQNENAMRYLPKRISKILAPGDRTKQKKYRSRIKKLIIERNSVLHSGNTKNFSAEYLSEEGYQISRQILNKLGYLNDLENFTSKDDLRKWERSTP